jgi:uncharacterized membrane protein YedE/YeeE
MKGRGAAAEMLGRLGFVLLGSLVLWGALLLASAVADSWSEGATAFTRLVPSRDANAWAWLAGLSVVMAIGAAVFGAAFLATRAARGPSDH